jgi:imidazole glycerol phosphate synthase subunit HisF
MESRNASEILLTSVNLDGTMKGYDVEMIKIYLLQYLFQ